MVELVPVRLVSRLHLVGLGPLDAVEPAGRQVGPSWHPPSAVRPGLVVVATQRLDGPVQPGRCALSQFMMKKERRL